MQNGTVYLLLLFGSLLQGRYAQQLFFVEGIGTLAVHVEQFGIGSETLQCICIYVFYLAVFLQVIVFDVVPARQTADIAFCHIVVLGIILI